MKKDKKEKLDKKLLMLNLKRLYKYVSGQKKYIFIFVVFVLLQTAVGVIIPLISAKLIIYLTDGLFMQLLLTSLVILAINGVNNIFNYVLGYCSDKIEDKTVNKLQIDFAREFLKLEISEIDKASTGSFLERINGDTGTMSYVFFTLTRITTSTLSKVGTMVTVFLLNKIIFVYFVVIAIISYVMGEIRNNIQEKRWKMMRKTREEKYSLINELVRGIRDIKVLNAIDSVMKKTEENIVKVTKESFISNRISSKFSLVNGFFYDTTNFLFLALGSYLCVNNLMTVPVFLMVYNYRGSISFLFNSFSDLTRCLREFNLSANRVFEIIYDGEFKKETFGTKHLNNFDGDIEFRDVTFSYDGKKNVLKKMNFHITPNETVGFVGRSGAGKSTIFNLITKMYATSKGSILLDGVNINELDRSSIRDNMSIITQNPYIFNFSIKENLLLANPKASMKEIRNACKLACIDDYIMSLDEKYETKLGEGGLILSGGQKQRLAIARALLTKTEIILFDEATSALDNETQADIQKAIKNLKGEYTILIIAHRLSTIVDCDRIFVVDKGNVVGVGKHKKLMKENAVYQKLYQMESK